MEGLFQKADEILAALDRGDYEIDSEKAAKMVITTTSQLRDDLGAGWFERRRSRKTSHASFANEFANARTNYEKFRPVEDYVTARWAEQVKDWFNIGWANGIFRRSVKLNDQDLRGLILAEMYRRKKASEEQLTSVPEFAKLFGVNENMVNFDLEYLVDKGLVEGNVISGLGTTKKYVLVHDISARGIDVVDGRGRENFAINYNVISIAENFSGQLGIGNSVNQIQGSGTINNFADLYQYMERNLTSDQNSKLKPLVQEVESQVRTDSVKSSTLKRISDIVGTYGPAAMVVTDTLSRILGLKA